MSCLLTKFVSGAVVVIAAMVQKAIAMCTSLSVLCAETKMLSSTCITCSRRDLQQIPSSELLLESVTLHSYHSTDSGSLVRQHWCIDTHERPGFVTEGTNDQSDIDTCQSASLESAQTRCCL